MIADSLFGHRSIRKYRPDPVPGELLNRILEAGSRASTTGNMQVYSIIVTTDPAIKKELSPCHFNQGMVTEAPVLLTFCADFNRFIQWCNLRNATPGYDNFLSFMTAAIDALLAAQNVCIAAEDSGLGICYLGTTTYNAGKIIDILHLPGGVVPVTTVALGYPDESPDLTDRLPMEAIIHRERYRDYTPDRINKYYAEKESLESYKQFIREHDKETLAQVFTDIRYTRKDNVFFSKSLLDVLEQQGFMNHD